jgi:GTP cyclohydrolase I
MNTAVNASKIIIDNENKRIISKEEAEEAVKTLITYIGEDPEREGLLETPKRVIKSFNEFYAGYSQDPEIFLSKTFEDIEGYNDVVLLKNINFESHCEHHRFQ